MRKRSRALAR